MESDDTSTKKRSAQMTLKHGTVHSAPVKCLKTAFSTSSEPAGQCITSIPAAVYCLSAARLTSVTVCPLLHLLFVYITIVTRELTVPRWKDFNVCTVEKHSRKCAFSTNSGKLHITIIKLTSYRNTQVKQCLRAKSS